MMRTLIALLVSSLLWTALPTDTWAQKSGISQADRREAKRLFNQAHLAYRRGDYEEAILRWQESYDLSQEPLIFLSIANAYERLGDSAQTLDYLKKWRGKAPRREHEELDGRIERLEVRVREQEAKRKKEQEQATPPAAEVPDDGKPEGEVPPDDDEDDSGDVAVWPVVGWSLVGVGGAAVIAGLVVDAVAAAARPVEQDACVNQGDKLYCRESLGADIDASNTLAIAGDVTWIAGTVLAAGGVVVLLTLAQDESDTSSDNDGDARVVPLVGPTGAGLLLTAQF